MKTIWVVLLSLVCNGVWAEPLFYVLDLRHTGDAALHANRRSVSPTAALPYVVVDTPIMKCCFHIGSKPGQHKSSIRINEQTPPLSSGEGEETFQFAGYVNRELTRTRRAMDTLAFGLADMTSVTPKGKQTYEITMAGGVKPVIVRHCLGAEGVNFRLYRRVADLKPYATYYYALGYDTEPDCR